MKQILSVFIAFGLMLIMHSVYACEDQAVNKQTVVKFYEAAINQKDFQAAAKYLGKRYTQHNPKVADGPEGFKKLIQYLRDTYPQAHGEIKHIFVDGNYVILHVYSVREPGARGRAVVDIFKLENHKIVEHWDVAQDIPTESANSNTMF